ncbi:phenylalanine--tRNA ligase subunit beta [Botrimarina hoheduenensis]|uniref:Phenylalanine--tRNA ligase beta subunit n=1 Tax=Botrimarina hoheduenensis TaxID=2528000 RepID=A0A5C5WAC6_9BACT|nr:phenylalanine--tRNA ligase subunit beta [Botrimarina hoheduenensis]TWT47457.1 Phenylalanine--tRNA ligase beta subunit [Botrimarina hoheduenensis]
MIVSTEWLAEYVDLPASVEELTERLTLSGLNLEEVQRVGDDNAIDLEVTSNRSDCLGHLGVAREIAVLWDRPLKRPEPQPQDSGEPIARATSVTNNCPELCARYTARVIKGVKIGPSPAWLQKRLQTLGIATVNNVVDITNYVMMEIGQPLHAFDHAKLAGGQIVVRRATVGEKFTAIDHKTYDLSGDEVVIADARRPVALGGVMGGAETEISDETVDVLIEAADFDPLTVRGAARRHVLFSPSSYRFERGVDPEGIDWASRRCCELILELAGGVLCEGVVDVGGPRPRQLENNRDHIKLRYPQIERVLGVVIPSETVRKVLVDLGCVETHNCDHCVKVVPPSWRADLTREVDLIEEVARIYGYDKVPTASQLPIVPSALRREDVVLDRIRRVLTAAGFDEAYTLSAVEPELIDAFRPWTEKPALSTSTSVLRGATCLRQTLVPSLLVCRKTNEALSNPVIEQFEIAKVYLPRDGGAPEERRMLAIASGGGLLELKGVIEALLREVAPRAKYTHVATSGGVLDAQRSVGLVLNGQPLCLLGELSAAGRKRFGLRGPASVAELSLGVLMESVELVPTTVALSPYPPVSRDVNLIVDESIAWAQIEAVACATGGSLVERVVFQDDSFRDATQIGTGKKSVVFRLQLRSPDATLTSDQADGVVSRVLTALEADLGGKLRA